MNDYNGNNPLNVDTNSTTNEYSNDKKTCTYRGHPIEENVKRDDITNAIIDPRITEIKYKTFIDCYSLQSVTIPSSVTKISYGAFSGCTSLSSVILPDGLKEIGTKAFSFSASLRSIVLPFSVECIGPEAFSHCYSLLSVLFSLSSACTAANSSTCRIPTTTTTASITTTSTTTTRIYEEAFGYCQSLISVTLPHNIRLVQIVGDTDNNQFKKCSELFNAVINDSNNDNNTSNSNKSFDDINAWLRQRYNNLPLHQACCDPKISLNQILSIKSKTPKALIDATDALGMTALHILVCNPYATADIIRAIVTLFTSAAAATAAKAAAVRMVSFNNKTALTLYLEMNNLYEKLHKEIQTDDHSHHLSLMSLLNEGSSEGVEWKHMDCIMALQSSSFETGTQDNSSGLYPFMQAAIFEQCNLEIVYHLALQNVEHLYTHATTYTKKRKRCHSE